MKLKFRRDRLKLALRLTGKNRVELVQYCEDYFDGYVPSIISNDMNMGLLVNGTGEVAFREVEYLASAIGVPVGFFYYENVDISKARINDDGSLLIDITIAEEKKEFPLYVYT